MDGKRKAILRASLSIIATFMVIGIVGAGLSLLQVPVSIPNAGAVKTVGVGIYWDSLCTSRTTSITWGTLASGTNKTITVYIKNEANSAVTISKSVRNWVPSTAVNYMTLGWNYANQTIGINKIQQVNLTLALASNVTNITNFNFDIIITALG